MDISLEDLIGLWLGRYATLDIDLARTDGEDGWESYRYEGILDGPYVGDGPGVGFMLGSRLISGNIAVAGPCISFDPVLPKHAAPILTDQYVELRVVELPVIAKVDTNEAKWEASLADHRAVRCRLAISDVPA